MRGNAKRQAGRPSKGLYSATRGNPFFVTEVLAAAADAVPVTVRDAVLARAARLPPAAREIAELAFPVAAPDSSLESAGGPCGAFRCARRAPRSAILAKLGVTTRAEAIALTRKEPDHKT